MPGDLCRGRWQLSLAAGAKGSEEERGLSSGRKIPCAASTTLVNGMKWKTWLKFKWQF